MLKDEKSELRRLNDWYGRLCWYGLFMGFIFGIRVWSWLCELERGGYVKVVWLIFTIYSC